ncbi:MAG: CZB domain-containing protein [Sphingomonadaceae bacterium]
MTRHAKSSHIRWRAHVQALIAGLDVGERETPVDHRQCEFGQWFYREGFNAFGHWQIFQDVEFSHELLHAVFQLIQGALCAGNPARAAVLAVQLMGISQPLLEAIDLLQEEIRSREQEAF